MKGLVINETLKAWHGRRIGLAMMMMSILILFIFIVAIAIDQSFGLLLTTEEFVTIGSVLHIFIMLYSFVLVTGAISGEASTGTIKQLLIKPVSRHRVLLSKWLTNLVISFLLYCFVLALLFAFGLFFPHVVPLSSTFYYLFETALYTTPSLIFYVALATLIAVITKNTAVTIVLTILPYFFADLFVLLAAEYDWASWIVFAHIDVFNNYNPVSLAPAPFPSMWASIGFLLIHIALMLAIAHVIYKRQDVL
ncbi:ABC transporter permease [Geomicrobium sp. JCM 19038]|uniref:ABC transporter permease n=1 Tax=Geomicrobium sp. JCM 19038 TaxID=1460635 RepID=UPI00045F3D65|nr:ABC transporter permease subunit [Geomicrobium sp. JCM 19038]GAK07826.1 bacitracin transport permease protein BcrB [Geomicrobium sp. JCM 19038]